MTGHSYSAWILDGRVGAIDPDYSESYIVKSLKGGAGLHICHIDGDGGYKIYHLIGNKAYSVIVTVLESASGEDISNLNIDIDTSDFNEVNIYFSNEGSGVDMNFIVSICEDYVALETKNSKYAISSHQQTAPQAPRPPIVS